MPLASARKECVARGRYLNKKIGRTSDDGEGALAPNSFANYVFKRQLIILGRGNFLATKLGPHFFGLARGPERIRIRIIGPYIACPKN